MRVLYGINSQPLVEVRKKKEAWEGGIETTLLQPPEMIFCSFYLTDGGGGQQIIVAPCVLYCLPRADYYQICCLAMREYIITGLDNTHYIGKQALSIGK